MTLLLSGTNGVSDVDGSASTPAVRGSDTNTGIFFPAADTVAIATGGAEAMRVNSSQNVGIGTSSPNVRTEVSGTEAAVSLRVNTQNSGNSASNYSEVQLADVGTVRSYWRNVRDGTGATIFSYNDHLRFQSGSTERARIDTSGNLLVNGTSGDPNPGVFIYKSGAVSQGNSAGGSGFEFASFRRSGTQIGTITQNGTTAVAYNTTSDYRLKENVQPLTGALARVAALKPVTYTWKSAPDEIGEGFIAHELAEVCPQAVTGEKDAVNEDGSIKAQSIDTSFLVATLTAAIQELTAKLDAAEARIAALEAK